jgi:hypothetical protein
MPPTTSKEETKMLDRNSAKSPIADIAFTAEEQEVLATGRRASKNLRRSTFDDWVCVGRAILLIRKRADASVTGKRARDVRRKALLTEYGFGWFSSAGSSRLLRVMEKLPEVLAWRETLSEFERMRWASPQAVFLKCPTFGQVNATPRIQTRAMSVRDLLHLPSAKAAQLIFDRAPAKAWALRRALDELLDGNSAPRPTSGWSADRKRAASSASAAAA